MIRLILTTFSCEGDAARVVRQLLEERLIACGTLCPQVRSLYRWQGSIEDASEVMVWLKTTDEKASAAQEKLIELHPYETPEVILVSPHDVSVKYRDWVLAECSDQL